MEEKSRQRVREQAEKDFKNLKLKERRFQMSLEKEYET
jgi:hypothetical protein